MEAADKNFNKKGRQQAIYLGFFGASCAIRTRDLRFRRPTLYPAELRRHIASFIIAIRIANTSCHQRFSYQKNDKGKEK